MNTASSVTDWFAATRYGLFIHWGPYSVAARGEWVLNRENIPLDVYQREIVQHWHAENYDPRAWCQLARDANMGYVVLTTRHHDGFCLWDTQTTNWNAVQQGPQRDLVASFVEACREFDLKIGFYYSVADWSHPDYPTAYARDWPLNWPDERARLRFMAFYEAQLEELMTRYGPIDVLWYDGCLPQPLDGSRVNQRVKAWQPQILMNDRNEAPHDFICCEQAIHPPAEGPWESCMTLNQNWGYHAGDNNWKNARTVARMLCECAASGGNLLLNIGPYANGEVPPESAAILRQVGEWLHTNGDFLSHSERQPFGWTNWGHFTARGNTLYCHIFESPGRFLILVDLDCEIQSARLLASGELLSFEQQGPRAQIGPLPPIGTIATTIELKMNQPPRALTPKTTFWIPG